MKARRLQLMVGAVIVAAVLAAVAYQGTQSTVFFYAPGEVMAEPQRFRDETIRIGALVQPGSTRFDAENVQLHFKVTDESQKAIPVVFEGVKPDMYREGQGVVVEGRLDRSGVFRADTLLVKHSEDYSVSEDKVAVQEQAYRKMQAQ